MNGSRTVDRRSLMICSTSGTPCFPILETRRLRLRAFAPGDARCVQELAGDVRIADVTAQIPHPYPDGAAEAWISTHRPRREAGTGLVYALTLRADGVLIGAASIMGIRDREGELGYWLGVPYWGLGYCTEGVGALLDFAAQSGLVRRVYARHLQRNPASGRVLLKLGFTHCGSETGACGYRHAREAIEVYERHLRMCP